MTLNRTWRQFGYRGVKPHSSFTGSTATVSSAHFRFQFLFPNFEFPVPVSVLSGFGVTGFWISNFQFGFGLNLFAFRFPARFRASLQIAFQISGKLMEFSIARLGLVWTFRLHVPASCLDSSW